MKKRITLIVLTIAILVSTVYYTSKKADAFVFTWTTVVLGGLLVSGLVATGYTLTHKNEAMDLANDFDSWLADMSNSSFDEVSYKVRKAGVMTAVKVAKDTFTHAKNFVDGLSTNNKAIDKNTMAVPKDLWSVQALYLNNKFGTYTATKPDKTYVKDNTKNIIYNGTASLQVTTPNKSLRYNLIPTNSADISDIKYFPVRTEYIDKMGNRKIAYKIIANKQFQATILDYNTSDSYGSAKSFVDSGLDSSGQTARWYQMYIGQFYSWEVNSAIDGIINSLFYNISLNVNHTDFSTNNKSDSGFKNIVDAYEQLILGNMSVAKEFTETIPLEVDNDYTEDAVEVRPFTVIDGGKNDDDNDPDYEYIPVTVGALGKPQTEQDLQEYIDSVNSSVNSYVLP